jgi:hypothetical protein
MPRSHETNVSKEQLSHPGSWYPVDSSRVSEMRYDSGLREIHVIFKDGTPWTYQGVDEGIFNRFRSAESPGRFINNVLNSFPYHRGGFDYASFADLTDEEA